MLRAQERGPRSSDGTPASSVARAPFYGFRPAPPLPAAPSGPLGPGAPFDSGHATLAASRATSCCASSDRISSSTLN